MGSYALEVSPELVSAVTEAVLDEIADWQDRPLEAAYILWFSSMHCGSRSATRAPSATKPCTSHSAFVPTAARSSWAYGSNRPRAPNSGLRVMTELKNRAIEDILIAVVDGLKGFPDAI